MGWDKVGRLVANDIINPALEHMPVEIFGASWDSGDAYNAIGTIWWERLQEQMQLGQLTNRSVGGTEAPDMENLAYATHTTFLKALYLLHVGGNEQYLQDVTNAKISFGLIHAVRSMLSLLTAGSRIESSAMTATGAGWLTSSVNNRWSGGSYKYTTGIGDYMEFVVDGTTYPIVYLALIAFDAASFNGADVEIKIDGVVQQTVSLHDRLSSAHYNNTALGHMIVTIPLTTGSHTIRITHAANNGASSYLVVDVAFLPSATPPPIIVVKDPMLPSSNQTEMDAIDAALVAAESGFTNVYHCNLQLGWDATLMLGVDDLHPTDLGEAHIADRLRSTAALIPMSLGLNTALKRYDAIPTLASRRESPWQVIAGRYLTDMCPGVLAPTQTIPFSAGLMTFSPVWIPTLLTVDTLHLYIYTAGTAGATMRAGIYADDGNGKPGALLVDAGTVVVTSTGQKVWTLATPIQLKPGLHHIAAVTQGAPTTGPMPPCWTNYSWPYPPIEAGPIIGYFLSATTGALPSTAAAATNNGTVRPVIQMHVLSVP